MSSTYRKRKRSAQIFDNAVMIRPYKRRALTRTKTKRFIPGVDRTGGFYGRYSGRSGELKFHDVDLDDAVVATDGSAVTASINLIAQGITESTRVGRKCTIRSINWKFRVDMPEVNDVTTPNTAEEIRVILYLDKQCNGATIADTDLLETPSVQSFRNLANSSRFQVLLDKLVVLNWRTLASESATNYDQAEVITEHTFYKKCNIPLEFDSTVGAITEIRSNNLGVLLISKSGTGGFLSKIRLRFSDN